MSYESQPENIDYRSTLNVARVHNALAREHPDRVAESRPVSLWVALGAIAVTALGFTFFGAYRSTGADGLMEYNRFGSSYQPRVPDPLVPETTADDGNLAARGEKVYKNMCASCHLPNGSGQPGTIPPLAGSEWVVGSSERLASIVSYGLTGPVTVKGQVYNGLMAAHAPPKLTPKDLAAVLTYIRQAWDNGASEISVEQMTAYLARTKGRLAFFTEAELKSIPEDQMLDPAPEPAP